MALHRLPTQGGTSDALDRVGQVMGLIWVAMIPANLMHFFWHSGWSN